MVIKRLRVHLVLAHPPVEDHLGCNVEVTAIEQANGSWLVGCMQCGEGVKGRNLVEACRFWNEKNMPAAENQPY